MTSTLTYNGLVARIDFSAEDEAFVGRVIGINDEVTFRAASVPELVSAFHQAVDGYIQACAKAGKAPEKAYSGKLMVRIDPAVHAQAARAAELAGKSLTQWTEEVLRAAANPHQVHSHPAPELQTAAPANTSPKAPKPQSVVAPSFVPKASPQKPHKPGSALALLPKKSPQCN